MAEILDPAPNGRFASIRALLLPVRLPHWLALVLLAATAIAAASYVPGLAFWRAEIAQGAGAPTAASHGLPPQVKPLVLVDMTPEDAEKINAALPFAAGKLGTLKPFRFSGNPEDFRRAQACLAAAGLYEAGDDAAGQRAVMQVVLNRVRHPAFPKTVCGVVFQGAERQTGCQFTFTCDGALHRILSDAMWQRSLILAQQALNGTIASKIGNATHYHADYVVPYWQPEMEKLAVVGRHLFFRWRGFWGKPAAFAGTAANTEPHMAALAERFTDHAGLPSLAVGQPSPEEQAALASGASTPATGSAKYPSAAGASLDPSFLAARESEGILLVQLRPGVPPGRTAMAALHACPDHGSCHVLGWLDGASMPQSLPAGQPSAQHLAFVYLRRSNGDDRVLWDCSQLPAGPDRNCLPGDAETRAGYINGRVGPAGG